MKPNRDNEAAAIVIALVLWLGTLWLIYVANYVD